MKTGNYLTILFLIHIISMAFNRYYFYSFMKDNGFDPNPWKTKRFLTINEIANYYLRQPELLSSQIKDFIILKKWEVGNWISLPLSLIAFVILAIILK